MFWNKNCKPSADPRPVDAVPVNYATGLLGIKPSKVCQWVIGHEVAYWEDADGTKLVSLAGVEQRRRQWHETQQKREWTAQRKQRVAKENATEEAPSPWTPICLPIERSVA
jgi:hypothetical protein